MGGDLLARALVLALLCGGATLALADPPTASAQPAASAQPTASALKAEREQFFETKVRPIFSARCWSCHAAEKQEAGLRLDRADGFKTEEGAKVVEPGQPGKSRLIEAVHYDSDTQMPPSGKLPAEEIAALERWIELGAVWPAGTVDVSSMSGRIAHARQAHWALQPLQRTAAPQVGNAANFVDAFVIDRLKQEGLLLSPPADRRTLLRRVTFDLIGLPPTPGEYEDFVRDESSQAFAKVVDRLLASPQYGERWARHWLDVARYADTKGYVFTEEIRYAYSFTYRDYVVRAFNEDLPIDRFFFEQLAADLAPEPHDPKSLAALGFLTLGRRFSNNTHDIIDDRIDVVTRGLLGLTVTCARCHDHKYDPIPTADYYSLYGVFASTHEPKDLPVLEPPNEKSEAYQAFQKELTKREGKLQDFQQTKHQALLKHLRENVAEYLTEVVRQGSGEPIPPGTDLSLAPNELKPPGVQRWKRYLQQTAKPRHPVWAAWGRLSSLKGEPFAKELEKWVAELKDESQKAPPVNPHLRAAVLEKTPGSAQELALLYARLFEEAVKQWNALPEQDRLEKLPDDGWEELRNVLFVDNGPTTVPLGEARPFFDRATTNELTSLQKQVDAWRVSSPEAPPRGMALFDNPNPTEPQIFLRGSPDRRGERVPRRFLQVLAGPNAAPFKQGSGRLEMAREIIKPDNPLTARVFVNRIWQHHFGRGLVDSPSDFGVRTPPPSHPELLDELAATFQSSGWSLKQLHRTLLLTRVYQQASLDRADARSVDPENVLLWRANRQRLEFEPLRDSVLAVAGRLDLTLGGRPLNFWNEAEPRRRSLYGFVDRQDLAAVLRAFDFASPESSTELRPRTIVPQQALFLMNSKFLLSQARYVLQRPEITSTRDPAQKIHRLFHLLYLRPAQPDELEGSLRYVQPANANSGSSPARVWETYVQALLMSNEFAYVD